ERHVSTPTYPARIAGRQWASSSPRESRYRVHQAGQGATGATILSYGPDAGTPSRMGAARKVTVQLPADLLDRAQRSSGKNLTANIWQGLRLVAAARPTKGSGASGGRFASPSTCGRS